MEEALLGAYLALLLIMIFWPVVRYAYRCTQRRWFPNRWLERELRLREEELSRTAPTIYTDRSSTVYTELQESGADASSYPWEDYSVTIREDERPNPRIQELRNEISLVKSAQASLTLGDRGALASLRLEFEGVDLESFAGVAGGLPGFVFGLRLAGELWWDKVGDDPFFVSGLGAGGWNELSSDGCGCAMFLMFGVIGWLFLAGFLLLPVLMFSAFTGMVGAGVAYGLLAAGRFLVRSVCHLFKRSNENHGD